MVDFGKSVKAAEREAKAKKSAIQSSKKSVAPYGYKKDGTPRKRPAQQGRWKKGESGNPGGGWKPGQSGNPGGRPTKTPITDAMRAHLAAPYTGKEKKFAGLTNAHVLAIKQFDLAVEGGDMRAAVEIADRVEGKTVQQVQMSGPGGGAIPYTQVSREENERRLAEIEAMAGGAGDGNNAD